MNFTFAKMCVLRSKTLRLFNSHLNLNGRSLPSQHLILKTSSSFAGSSVHRPFSQIVSSPVLGVSQKLHTRKNDWFPLNYDQLWTILKRGQFRSTTHILISKFKASTCDFKLDWGTIRPYQSSSMRSLESSIFLCTIWAIPVIWILGKIKAYNQEVKSTMFPPCAIKYALH